MTNAAIARMLREIALYLEMDDVPFKPRAYEKVAYTIEALDEPLEEIYRRGGLKALEKLPGVGKGIAEKLEELLRTGRLSYYEELRKKYPVDVLDLTSIEGVGPKNVKALYEALGIRTIADLKAAAEAGKIRNLPHFGEKSEKKILKGLEFWEKRTGRFLLGAVLPLLEEIAARLERCGGVEKVAIAGSVRRRKETVGDGDLLVVASKPDAVMENFVRMPEVVHVYGRGQTKTMVRLDNGMDVDLRVVPEESFGAALNYFTGSKDHNVALRKIAIERGLKLNEYGVFRGEKRIAGRTEEEVYEALGLPYIPPELRENTGEIEAAREGRLPRLVEYGELRGDLQTQTSWTDGANSIEEMVREAQRLGLEYIAITDHTRSLAMTRGCDEAKLREQIAAIRALDRKLRGIKVLAGAEVNINKDGTLDIADEVLAELDVVGIAVHSHFQMSREEMTRRIVRAMENPHADILFHPTGRVLQKREPYDVDLDAILEAAKRTGTVLEIDAYPERLDLKDEHVRKAVAAGVPLVIDSDAHSVHQLAYTHYGVATARRGWATKKDILNTRPLADFLAALKDGKVGAKKRRRA
ncbi:MAG: DNA polymerase/3'-5' exonuclease PolX [Candidatus Binatia bacterium]|nr:MAG: DNA polymerase/3'-5' exonuclease PolX [Candidatus Binatia bacterium]